MNDIGVSYADLRNRIAVVTGAAQGIGAAIARQLGCHGVKVALLDQQKSVQTEAQRLATATGTITRGYCLDVSDKAAVETAIHNIEQVMGPVDILVNVAGILRPAPTLSITPDDWERSFAVNCNGVLNLCNAVAHRMIERRRGNIITVGSNAAITPRTRMAAYAASKAAAHQYTRCLGLELAPFGIRCNTVSPGSTDTPMQQQLYQSTDTMLNIVKGSAADYRLGIPLQRIAQSDDIAHAVCFLASDVARHITLHDLRVDGGATLDA